MAKVSVRYFAMLRELSGQGQEDVQIPAGATTSGLYSQLADRYGFPLGLSDIRVAVNDEFSTLDHRLAEGDEVVFLPPVSGG